MSPWLFNIYMDGVMRKVKGKVGEVGIKLYNEGRSGWLSSGKNCVVLLSAYVHSAAAPLAGG